MNEKYAIKAGLDRCLSSGRYVQLFLDDLVSLVINQKISPEIIFREIRALEGKEAPLLNNLDVDPCLIWHAEYEAELNRSPSVTKKYSEFTRSLLKGLHHKHYYVHQGDFISINVLNHNRKYANHSPLCAMMTKISDGTLTGEWIIFKKTEAGNTYLCLAKHTDGDNAIHNRLKASGNELG